ncbi:phosphotransferase [Bacillus sp. JJ722]|uniref:phosphotransferase n=1 Tax=Bacillus sp. JJ722 TaxID=3122973 RepID=UPI002FFF9D56
MRAVGYSGYLEGDSVFRSRLRAALKEKGANLHKVVKLRSNVFIVHTDRKKYLLKGFYNRKKYEAQKLLVRKLKENDFEQTYSFKNIPTFKYEGETYAWIQFLSSAKERFNFRSYTNRKKGLQLLEDFHSTTSEFYDSIPVNYFNQVEKWEERLEEFESNRRIIEKYVSSSYLDSWLDWGKRSLKGLIKNERELYEEPTCIVHGDVAHHNFFLKKDGNLNLIDFDLINKAPPIIDYLQYCNRIMPHIEDNSELWTYEQLRSYKDNHAFLYALLFPTDIFREWNRIIKEDSLRDRGYMHSVWELSVEEWPKRISLYKDIANMI